MPEGGLAKKKEGGGALVFQITRGGGHEIFISLTRERGGLLLTREENMIPGSFFVHRNLMFSQFVEQIASGPLPILTRLSQ